jgi:chondroitin 4-sulfotransferase 11
MIIPSKRLIFVHVQKTAGSSVRLAFGESPDPTEKHFLARELRSSCGAEVWNTYFKFAFVRNPWDRLVSWWSNINSHREAYERGLPLNNFQSFVLSRAFTFEEFLLNCDEEIIDTDGRKWIYRNQVDYLSGDDDQLIVDFVGRFETVDEDFALASRKAVGHELDLPRSNSSAHRHYSEYYSKAMEEYVAARYMRDIRAFGYVFERDFHVQRNGADEPRIPAVRPRDRQHPSRTDWRRFITVGSFARRGLVLPQDNLAKDAIAHSPRQRVAWMRRPSRGV